jgi:DNA-binding transcriptional MerR regulator
MLSRDTLWTLDELTAQVALALAVDYAGPVNGRVREVPDVRTVRFYTTLGLLDRPAAMRGRTALYGPRHLWQLVAIKRLQAKGLSLAEVQARLVGLTDGALRKLAQVPAEGNAQAEAEVGGTRKKAETRRDGFWRETPEPAPPAGGEEATEMRPLTGVPLAAGATLLLEAVRPLDEHDLAALRVAAAPLLKLLEARRLLGDQGTNNTKGDPP